MFGRETARRRHGPARYPRARRRGWPSRLILLAPLIWVLSGCYGKQALRQPVTVDEIAADIEQIRTDQSNINRDIEQIEVQLAQQAELIRNLQTENQYLYEEMGQRLSGIDAKLQDAIGRTSGYSSSSGPYWSGSGTMGQDGDPASGRGVGGSGVPGSTAPGGATSGNERERVSAFSDDDWRGDSRTSSESETDRDRNAAGVGSGPLTDSGIPAPEAPAPSGIDPASQGVDSGAGAPEDVQAKRVYDQSYLDYSRGNYSLAILGFSEFLRRSPHSDLSDNAQYWIAECYYAQADYRQASAEYRKVVDNYPRTDRVAGALLKTGFCALQLDRTAEARSYLSEVTERFPESEEARVARDKLRTMQ